MKVTKAIAKKYPNAPLFTIHDSVTTTKEYAEKVKTILVNELYDQVGIPPKIKEEEWKPDNGKLKAYLQG